jgi:hypothetical protein
MPFPQINYCLVCEGVRQELGGKFSLLGFFGATPNVDVGVGRLDQPLQLAFLFGFGPVTDATQAYNYTISVLNPDRSVLFQTPAAKINVILNKPGLILTAFPFIPKTSGLRTITVVVNGETRFESTFMIRQGTPQELAMLPGAAVH